MFINCSLIFEARRQEGSIRARSLAIEVAAQARIVVGGQEPQALLRSFLQDADYAVQSSAVARTYPETP